MKILMVCLGNICRSPLAEGILQNKAHQAGLSWSVESAGSSAQTGSTPHYLSQKVAQLNNIDISCQRARQFVKEDMLTYDRIYAMSDDVLRDIKRIAREYWNENKVRLLLDEVYPGMNRSVPDPWYGPEPGYHEVFDMISAACDRIISNSTTQTIAQKSAMTNHN